MKDALSTRTIGQQAEQYASDYLQARGLRLLAKNYRCRYGEIDLIMQDSHDIVFVEVRSRRNTNYGTAAESINMTKQKKIIVTAINYLKQQGWLDKMNSRFDIIGIHPTAQAHSLEWIKDAFSADDF